MAISLYTLRTAWKPVQPDLCRRYHFLLRHSSCLSYSRSRSTAALRQVQSRADYRKRGTAMETLESMRGEVKTELLTHIIPFWRALRDDTYGGYYGWLSYDLALDQKAEKGCILNSRITWFFSNATRHIERDFLQRKTATVQAIRRGAFGGSKARLCLFERTLYRPGVRRHLLVVKL